VHRKFLKESLIEKRVLGRLSHKWEANIKMDVEDVENDLRAIIMKR
jgi:hypothetical protein